MKVSYRLAQRDDAAEIAQLELTHMHDELGANGQEMAGQHFSEPQITSLINQGWIMLACCDSKIIGYVIAGPWSLFKSWSIYQAILKRLPSIEMGYSRLSESNSCQYGPIWIHSNHRGQGIFEQLVSQLARHVGKKLPYMVTFIAEDNALSFAAHTRKASMEVVDYFGFQQRDYYLLVLAN
ncbi:GNAT family N-acetyltransferase [Shewanella sp. 4_MG-2023]|uniref:GNAT family N-acetyltransferase n=1 Tax=Shewanella sp. 4_MG-2023 TaxID=3062652 RepID=UPI0026E2AC28|nr:GNAT family N-acetyltransferase [Shewanella sp. 4_MG-2023]MDO6678318.1 GNAT family N-acetyltransferase [Shewanella sp. 4_MG-2023]